MWKYIPCQSRVEIEDAGLCTSYGIQVLDEAGNEVVRYADVSSDEATVVALCARCNAAELSPIHLPEVIEDVLYTPCGL